MGHVIFNIFLGGRGSKKIGAREAKKSWEGYFLFWFNSECGTAKLSHPLFVFFDCSSRYVAFMELIHLKDFIDNPIRYRYLRASLVRIFWAKFVYGKKSQCPTLLRSENILGTTNNRNDETKQNETHARTKPHVGAVPHHKNCWSKKSRSPKLGPKSVVKSGAWDSRSPPATPHCL